MEDSDQTCHVVHTVLQSFMQFPRIAGLVLPIFFRTSGTITLYDTTTELPASLDSIPILAW